jgi:hypothetical protein
MVRMENLHAIARTLDVRTSELMASGLPTPVDHNDPNKSALRGLRIALTPAVPLLAPSVPPREEPSIKRLRRMTHDSAVLYAEDSYGSVAADLPALIRAANAPGHP